MNNPFKSSLANRQSQIGLWLGLPNSYTAEIIAGAGFDWLLIDCEHAPNTLESVLLQLQAIAAYAAHPVVRPSCNDAVEIKRLLDIGAQTLLVPMVNWAHDARQAVAATRYPPRGIRGVGSALARASRWNRTSQYLQHADTEICMLVQAETRQAIDNIEEICAVDGVDGVFIGPSDLAADMGHLGNPGHPEVQRVVEEAIARITKCQRAVGILTSDVSLAQRYIGLGTVFTAVGVDATLLARAAEHLAASFNDGKPGQVQSVAQGY